MRRGDIRTITVNDQKLDACFLGSGHYCRAYLVGDTVYCYVKQEDYMKEMVARCSRMPHIPDVKEHGEVSIHGKFYNLYSMPFYEPLTAQHVQAWQDYRALQREHKAAQDEVKAKQDFWRHPGAFWDIYNNEVNVVFVDRVKSYPALATLAVALEEMADNMANYGSGCGFEFAPRNLGVDTYGNLVLRDVCFDAEKIARDKRRPNK